MNARNMFLGLCVVAVASLVGCGGESRPGLSEAQQAALVAGERGNIVTAVQTAFWRLEAYLLTTEGHVVANSEGMHAKIDAWLASYVAALPGPDAVLLGSDELDASQRGRVDEIWRDMIVALEHDRLQTKMADTAVATHVAQQLARLSDSEITENP
jgi:hypothetical protein